MTLPDTKHANLYNVEMTLHRMPTLMIQSKCPPNEYHTEWNTPCDTRAQY